MTVENLPTAGFMDFFLLLLLLQWLLPLTDSSHFRASSRTSSAATTSSSPVADSKFQILSGVSSCRYPNLSAITEIRINECPFITSKGGDHEPEEKLPFEDPPRRAPAQSQKTPPSFKVKTLLHPPLPFSSPSPCAGLREEQARRGSCEGRPAKRASPNGDKGSSRRQPSFPLSAALTPPSSSSLQEGRCIPSENRTWRASSIASSTDREDTSRGTRNGGGTTNGCSSLTRAAISGWRPLAPG